ncbi:MAG: deoxyribodipyrimidine photo-lyase [Kordiimonadaceae bacterium]|nr:deoxyribodipyrimidine photo-lyase [Kordiimonadaceae bacterium]MBO6567783.1 deoxyribodipyrimidine photo-lyase [Kordiimonadaceae bacterium]MBO6963002.1 deoxyribodipyrimidine photo-lyase [Kordiimonadaceae bacterium]
MSKPIIVLLSNALRLADNAALSEAVSSGAPVIPVFIFDEQSPKVRPLGAASKWWLLQSLSNLSSRLKAMGSMLVVRRGVAAKTVQELVEETDAGAVHVMRGYTPSARALEEQLHEIYADTDIRIRRFAGNLLIEPEAVRTKTGNPYTVFSPFWRAASVLIDTVAPQPTPTKLLAPKDWPANDGVESLGLEPQPAYWAEPIAEAWVPGEAAALDRLRSFLDGPVLDYKAARDFPAIDATSALSPYLAFGEIGPRTIWWHTKLQMNANESITKGAAHFLRELGWREFSSHLLFNQPHMQSEPMRQQFRDFPWIEGEGDFLTAWQKGLTGFPIVDAGMRQLWQTGWMHNRVRMIVASFLVKDLLWHWREGETWFWDTLVDADFGNNIASWQWVAGCGADAAPYFRIFNPITQGEKFDPKGDYVRRYVPELADMPNNYIHKPFEAPVGELQMAGVKLGSTYPKPIVNRKIAREKALAALASIKKPD